MDKDRQQNYNLARNEIKKYIGKPLTHDVIKSIQAIVVGPNGQHGYRTGSGFTPIRNEKTGEIRYCSPDAFTRSIQEELGQLLVWYNEATSIIEKAARLHWGLVKIHPFYDGNGRTARLLILLVLCNQGHDDLACIKLEKYFETNRHEYDSSLDDGEFTYLGFKEMSYKFLSYLQQGLN